MTENVEETKDKAGEVNGSGEGESRKETSTMPAAGQTRDTGSNGNGAALGTPGKYDGYRVGGTGNTGQEITHILGRGPRHIIYCYRIKGRQTAVRIENADEIEKQIAPLLKEFARLGILSERLRRKRRANARRYIGMSLHAAITACAIAPDGLFDEARAFIRTKADQLARLVFLAATFASATALAMALLSAATVDPSRATYWNAALAGTLGGFISSLIRSSDLEIDPFSTSLYVAAQGVIRVILGASFGTLAVTFVNADLLLGVIKPSSSSAEAAMTALAVTAGFSQRFVPELLGRMEGQMTQSADAASGGKDEPAEKKE